METSKQDIQFTMLPVSAAFMWGDNEWFFPAVYFTDDRVSVEIFTQVDLKKARAYRKKWGKALEDELLSDLKRQSIEMENPFFPHVFGEVTVNEVWLEPDFISWYEWDPENSEEGQNYFFARSRVKGYNCDPQKGWVFVHMEFCMPEFELDEFKDLEITISSDEEVVFGKRVGQLREGRQLSVIHPVTKEKHDIKILKCEQKEHNSMYYTQMTYKIEPVPEDELRLNEKDRDEFFDITHILEGKEENTEEGIYVNCSGVHVRKSDYIDWQIVCYRSDKKPATFNIVMPKERREVDADFFDQQPM